MSVLVVIAAAAAAPVEGTVRERGAGDPVPGARVEAGAAVAVADERGRFALDLPPGPQRILVTAPGFAPLSLEVTLPPEGALAEPLVVWLDRGGASGEIVIEARRPSPHAARQVLDQERVERTPGTHGDPVRLIQALPGVAMTREYSPGAGDVSLRGAAPSESRIYLDGVEIPYLYHFQQYASVVHTRLLDEVAVYPSAFGASYGDATGGIVAVTTRRAQADQVGGVASLDLVMGGAYLAAPAGGSAAVSLSGRRSYADLFSDSAQYTLWPTFWDYHGRADLAASPDHRRALVALGAGDAYGRYAGDAAELDPLEQADNPAFRFDRAFHGALLQHEDRLAGLGLSGAIAIVADSWAGSLPGAAQLRRETYLFLREDALIRPGEALSLAAGASAKASLLDRFVQTDRAWEELAAEAPLLARGEPADERLTQLKGGAYVEPRLRWGEAQLQPGLRLEADSASAEFSLDPRLTAQAALGAAWRLRAAAGRYSQAPPLDALSPATGDPSLGMARAWQGTAGADLALDAGLELTADLWGRSVQGAIVSRPDEPPSAADGYAYGAEVGGRYRLREKLFAWISLTVGRSFLDGAPADADQPYALNAVASWSPSRAWELGARYRYAAGLPYTLPAGSVYDGTTDSYLPEWGAPNGARLPDYQKLDLHAGRWQRFRRWSLLLYAEVWYVPPGANYLYPVYSYDYSERSLVVGPPLVPLVGGRAEF